MDFHRNPNAATPGLMIRDAGLLLLRLVTAGTVGFYHAWPQGVAGWEFFWKKGDWSLLNYLTAHGLPVPQVFAVIVVLIMVLGSLGLFFGVISRLSAGLLLAVTIGALVFNFLSPAAERFWLYAIIYFVLLICGPGCFSLAHWLNRR